MSMFGTVLAGGASFDDNLLFNFTREYARLLSAHDTEKTY
jgi:hypothetical protein